MKKNIGFILTEGFRNATVVETEAIFRLCIGSKINYIAEKTGFINGSNQYPIKATNTFENSEDLDVLIIPEIPMSQVGNEKLIAFVKKQSKSAKFVLAISSGAVLLAKAGLLTGKCCTTNHENIKLLEEYGVTVVNTNSFFKDDKFITAGPSTAAIEATFFITSILWGKEYAKMLELNLEYNPHANYIGFEQETLPHEGNQPLNVAVISPPGVLYLPDVAGAIDAFSSLPNAKIYFVWNEKGDNKTLGGPTIINNMTFSECPQMDVILSGAMLPKATVDKNLLEFYRKQSEKCKAIASTCGGVFSPGAAGLLKGRIATSNFHLRNSLKKVGAILVEKEIVVDGKYFSSGPAVGSYEIAIMVISRLFGHKTAAYVEQVYLEYNPSPFFDVGTPKKAGKIRYYASKFISVPLVTLFSMPLKKAYNHYSKIPL